MGGGGRVKGIDWGGGRRVTGVEYMSDMSW